VRAGLALNRQQADDRADGLSPRASGLARRLSKLNRTVKMTLHPKTPKDLLLAPVAAEIDFNLQSLRDKSPGEINEAVAIVLNVDTAGTDRAQRAAWILETALRMVELHDWHAEITDDAARLRLSGGSVTIDLGLSATILQYIENGS
jgi:hypothetical protein